MNNPFQTLGLSPGVIKRLNNEQITLLVKAVYRALMQIHHPDRKGSATVTREVNEAYESLEREVGKPLFEHWKEEFLKPRKSKQALQLMTQAQTLAEKDACIKDLEKGVLASMLANLQAKEGAPTKITALEPVPVQSLVSGRLLLSTVKQVILGAVIEATRASQNVPRMDGPVPGEFAEILLGNELKLTPLRRFEVALKAPLPADALWIAHKHRSTSFYVRRGTPQALSGMSIVAGMGAHFYSDERRKAHSTITRLLPGDSVESAIRAAEGAYRWDDLRKNSRVLTSFLGIGDYIVAGKIEGGDALFFVLGSLLGYEP